MPRRKGSEPSPQFADQQDTCIKQFDSWSEAEQVTFVESLLLRMCHHQHGQIDAFFKPMLQRDFISSLPGLYVNNGCNSVIWMWCGEWFIIIIIIGS